MDRVVLAWVALFWLTGKRRFLPRRITLYVFRYWFCSNPSPPRRTPSYPPLCLKLLSRLVVSGGRGVCVCVRMMGEAERNPVSSELDRDAGVLTHSR